MITRSEYERRRRLLEEQLQAALEMVRSGYEIGLRALEALRAESPEAEPAGAAPVPSVGGEPTAKAAAETSRPTPAAPLHSRLPINRWLDDVEAALPRLPEVFSKVDLVRALGYKPSRGTLLRMLDQLKQEGRIAILKTSQGGKPTTYRKILTP